MNRIERILNHPLYRQLMKEINEAEELRIYCKHGIEHSLDVARIMYIYALQQEQKENIDQSLIYAMGLLHDIGRSKEYSQGISHHEASGEVAEKILLECNYSKEECACIVSAIACHKTGPQGENSYGTLLYQADKLSRNCFFCQARESCYWDESIKNKTIMV